MSLLESTCISFFLPLHLDKQDNTLWIEDVPKDLIVLSESTVREFDTGECLEIVVKAEDTIQWNSCFPKSGSYASFL